MALLCLVLCGCVNRDYPYFVKWSKMDIVFVLDNTGSMASRIGAMKDSISGFAANLAAEAVETCFGVVSFGDTPSEQASLDAASTAEEMSTWLQALPGVEGGDGPENPLDSIRYAYDNFAWRSGADKCFVVITDVQCHQADDGSGFTSETVDGLTDFLRGNATVYAVSPLLVGEMAPYGDVRWLADGYGAGATVTAESYGTVRHSKGTGGSWVALPESGDIDLNAIGLTITP